MLTDDSAVADTIGDKGEFTVLDDAVGTAPRFGESDDESICERLAVEKNLALHGRR
jgi:hypothetical protein